MTRDELRRRFRLAVAGYAILAVSAVAGIYVTWHHTQQIQRTQAALLTSTRRENRHACDIVTATAQVFVDFIRKEIALRSARARRSDVSAPVRSFDRAEVAYWAKVTLPKLRAELAHHC